MTTFKEILNATEEELLQRLYKYRDEALTPGKRMAEVAKKEGLRAEQLTCALGFNPNARYLTEVLPLLGYATFEELASERNDIFVSDIYRRVPLDDILAVYAVVPQHADLLQIMQYLLKQRLERVERRIEETVNSLIIDKYKSEIRAIYNGGVAGVDFAEERLDRQDSGFRALLNEVGIIIDSKLIPAGDIFFRDTILPEEKRKLINKGLIPRELIQSRLNDENTDAAEKQVLHEYLRHHKE